MKINHEETKKTKKHLRALRFFVVDFLRNCYGSRKILPSIAFALLLAAILLVQPITYAQQEQMSDNPLVLLRVGQDQKKALKFGEAIYQAIGFGNTFMVVTAAVIEALQKVYGAGRLVEEIRGK